MTPKTENGNQELALLLKSHQEALTAQLSDDWAASLHTSAQHTTALVSATLAQLIQALDSGESEALMHPFAQWAREQAPLGMQVGTLLQICHALEHSLWDVVQNAGGAAAWQRKLADLVTMAQMAAVDALVTAREAQQRQTMFQKHAQLVQQIRELSTPVVKVWEEILVLPLVGTINSERATRVMESLLEGIVSQQAEIVIIDVTGVPIVDTNVVTHLMQAIKAASLLGTQSVLVGISAEVALAIVHLGVDLTRIETRRDLQAGIEFALQKLNLQVVPQDSTNVEYEVE
ncbi:MAG: STAS domain-containing protein [Gammaproteobacteria bacterium]